MYNTTHYTLLLLLLDYRDPKQYYVISFQVAWLIDTNADLTTHCLCFCSMSVLYVVSFLTASEEVIVIMCSVTFMLNVK